MGGRVSCTFSLRIFVLSLLAEGGRYPTILGSDIIKTRCSWSLSLNLLNLPSPSHKLYQLLKALNNNNITNNGNAIRDIESSQNLTGPLLANIAQVRVIQYQGG